MLALLNGCVTNWQAQKVAPQQVVESTGETEIRVTLKSGTNTVLQDPGVEGDSLVGWQQPLGKPTQGPRVRRAFALDDVQVISVKKSNTGANIAIGAATGVALFIGSLIVVVVLVCNSQGCD